MGKPTDWKPIIQKMERLLRLRSFPVAFKMLESRDDLERVPFLRRPSRLMTLCQMLNLARNFDWTVGADNDGFSLPSCPAMLGLRDKPEIYKDGTFRSMVWVRSRKDGRKFENSIPRLPLGRYEAVVMAPLVYNPFEPDIVLIYANPAQMIMLINALQFDDYEVMNFYCVGETSCADAIARCYLENRPSMTVPCYGERRYGHAQDDELVMALPAETVEKALKGLEALHRRGVRYPISYAGVEADVLSVLPQACIQLEHAVSETRGEGKDNRLLLGVTGGIASGKSTVSAMLEELGSPMIDFDKLAREVVEPGRPAYEEIVAHFGRQVVTLDGSLDRKALSDIVFNDREKRKKLESFTHPAIFDLFAQRVDEITSRDPDAIIQVAVPLLLELNLQHRFHKILVVHVPAEEQIKRLAKRDGISCEAAANILNSQLPIDEKPGYADFVIDNQGTLEETRRQVEDLWERLREIQTKRKEGLERS